MHCFNVYAGACSQVPITPDDSIPSCQLASVTPARSVPTCQLQSVTTMNESYPDWSDQDLAVLGLLFGPLWVKAKECEASSRPRGLTCMAMEKLFQKSWDSACDVKLKEGLYVTVRARRHRFNGKALIDLVAKYRSNTKARTRFLEHVAQTLRGHYESLSEIYRPKDTSTPLHEHWSSARAAIRPPPHPRVQLMRDAKRAAPVQSVRENVETPVEEELSFKQQMAAAVNIIKK